MTYKWAMGAAAMVLLAAPAQAQDVSATPAYGSVTLTAGFAQDPTSVGIQAGGAIYGGNVNDACYGYISYQPSLNLHYSAGSWPLYISAASDADTTLIINAPDGSWHCNDDADGQGLNPGVTFDAPQSGLYNIWVGTWQSGEGYEPTMVHISELGFSTGNPYSRAPNPALQPNSGALSLRAGFSDDPRRLAVSAGGDLDGSRGTGDSCWGQISEAPDVWLDYSANDQFDLYLSMEADRDTTLVVQGPQGEWYCDDDSARDLNPGIRVRDPAAGRYAIWAGRYSGGLPVDATLFVSELGFRGQIDVPAVLDYSLSSNYGSVSLQAGFMPDPYDVSLQAGGDVDVYEAVGQDCRGFATTAPDFNLNYQAGSFDLYISASSDADATLVVNAPDGSWYCNDDSAGSLNPGISFDQPASGRYDIWVGTYSQRGPQDAVLHISELGFHGAIDVPSVLDFSLPSNYGAVSLQAGFMPDPYNVALQAGGDVDVYEAVGQDCRGFVTTAPDFNLNYQAGSLDLYISASSDADATLVVNAPDGSWYCNDDSAGSLNPGISFDQPASGRYDIWVGTYSQRSPQEAVLHISELGFGDESQSGETLDYTLEANYGSVALQGGFSPDPHVVELTAGGPLAAESAADSMCRGYVTAAPDYELNFTPGSLALFISALSDDDTTLVINDPDGNWVCNDDNNGFNPGVRFQDPQPGTYDIWVGTYRQGGGAAARLEISELGFAN